MPEPTYDPALFDTKSFAAPGSAFEAPPFAETAPPFADENSSFDPAAAFGSHAATPADQDPFAADSFATGAYAPATEEAADSDGDNFLAAARRSARAAAEAENSRGSRLGLAWGSSAAKPEGEASGERSRLLVPIIIGAIIVLALVAGVVLSQRLRSNHTAVIVPAPAPPVVQNNGSFTPAPANCLRPTRRAPACRRCLSTWSGLLRPLLFPQHRAPRRRPLPRP